MKERELELKCILLSFNMSFESLG